MANTSDSPNSTYCGTIHHRLIGSAALGSSTRPASLATPSRLASTSAATTMATRARTSPVPILCSMVMPEDRRVNRRAAGTKSRS
ncbi:hypothetical protein CFC21_056527 [Triticum aestivum]|uniref:Uncharacterized protein n=1 Tax=Triticum aestivum TaxID=4565 RepID=A0A9R1GJ44_WHEAT|nr:hypothetical protein CFC21_056527 [Triticum aestivum]